MNQKIDTQQIFGFAISLAFWWFLLGNVQVAIGVIALVFVHELGHVIAARRLGVACSMPTFTPVGAYVQTERSSSVAEEAYIKLAGPFLGGLASIASLALGHIIGSPLLIQVGMVSVFLNLFNILPLDPFDGGGIAQVFGRWTVVPGALAFAAFIWIFSAGNSANLLFGAYYAYIAWQAYQNRSLQWQMRPRYFQTAATAKTAIAISYLAVGGGLAWIFLNPGLIPALLSSVGL